MSENVAEPTIAAQILAAVESGVSLHDAMRQAGLDPHVYDAASHRRARKVEPEAGDDALLALIDPAAQIAANAVLKRMRTPRRYRRWQAPRN